MFMRYSFVFINYKSTFEFPAHVVQLGLSLQPVLLALFFPFSHFIRITTFFIDQEDRFVSVYLIIKLVKQLNFDPKDFTVPV